MRTQIVLLLLFCLSVAGSPRAQPDDALQQGIDAYRQAQEATGREQRLAGFRRAEQWFANAVEQGFHTADVYTNLGTAALQAERLGAAIMAFRQALLLDPNHRRAQQNLAHARTLLPAWIARPQQDFFDSFFSWHRSWSLAERAAAAAFCFLLAALLIAVAVRWRVPLLRGMAVLPAALWLALLTSLAYDNWFPGNPAAVVMLDDTAVYAADSINAPASFAQPLLAGSEVEVLENRGDWVRIALADSRGGWVKRNSLGMLNTAGPDR
jgi:hypothetical protein